MLCDPFKQFLPQLIILVSCDKSCANGVIANAYNKFVRKVRYHHFPTMYLCGLHNDFRKGKKGRNKRKKEHQSHCNYE